MSSFEEANAPRVPEIDRPVAGPSLPLPTGNPSGAGWWTPDQQIVALREREQIDPTRLVRRGSYVHPLPLAYHQISPHWTYNVDAMDVDRYMDAQRCSGVIVLKNGVIILERYAMGRIASDRWQSASVAKGFTARS